MYFFYSFRLLEKLPLFESVTPPEFILDVFQGAQLASPAGLSISSKTCWFPFFTMFLGEVSERMVSYSSAILLKHALKARNFLNVISLEAGQPLVLPFNGKFLTVLLRTDSASNSLSCPFWRTMTHYQVIRENLGSHRSMGRKKSQSKKNLFIC